MNKYIKQIIISFTFILLFLNYNYNLYAATNNITSDIVLIEKQIPNTYEVKLPKKIDLNSKGEGEYQVIVNGNISPNAFIKVYPKESEINFTNLDSLNKRISANILQDKYTWGSNSVSNNEYATGSIKLEETPVGTYNGNLTFTITLDIIPNALPNRSLWTWDDFEYSDLYILLEDCKNLNINRVYLAFQIERLNSEEFKKIIKEFHENNINVYFVNGDPYWILDNNEQGVITRIINPIINYNQNVEELSKIDGVMFDIEVHGISDYEDHKTEYMNKYRDCLQLFYNECKDKLDFGIAVNLTQYKEFEDIYSEILINDCDYFAAMAYENNQQIDLIKEVEKVSKDYNKPLEIITLISQGDPNDNTFRTTIEAANEEFFQIKEFYKENSNISFAYHYYDDYFKSLIGH